MTQRFRSTIILLIFLFSLGANAQAPAESPYLTDDPKVATDTSEFNRKNKTVSFYYESTGGSQSGHTVNGAYFLRPDLQIMFEYSVFGPKAEFFIFGALDKAIYNYRDETIDGGYGLHLKYFMGNSVFVRLGVTRRDYHYTRTFNASSNQSYFDAEVNHVTVGIGNDWQWENFFLGFDWIKLNIFPFGYKLTNEQVAPGDSLKSQEDTARSEGSLQIGLHAGFSF